MKEKDKPKEEYDHDNILRVLNRLGTSQANKELVEQWDLELFGKGNKISSRTQYIQSVYRLLKWKPEKELLDLTKEDLIGFKMHLTNSKYNRNGSKKEWPYSPKTIEVYLSAIREFFRWKNQEEKFDWFKVKRSSKGRLTPEQILSQAEIMKLITAAGSKRNKAIVFALWESGCRRGEFLKLKIGDLNIKEDYATFTVDGKTGKRQCFLVASLPTLHEWLEEHPYKNDRNAWLWVKWKGQALNVSGLLRMLKEIGKRAGVDKPLFPHALRHSRCTFAAKQKTNEMVMRKLYGWSKTSEMPAVYVSLSGADTKDAALEMGGIKKEEKEKPVEPKKCPQCETVNTVDRLYCKKCRGPLTIDAAMKQQEQDFEKRLEERLDSMLEKKIDEIRKRKGLL